LFPREKFWSVADDTWGPDRELSEEVTFKASEEKKLPISIEVQRVKLKNPLKWCSFLQRLKTFPETLQPLAQVEDGKNGDSRSGRKVHAATFNVLRKWLWT